jgi:hypothetical protein
MAQIIVFEVSVGVEMEADEDGHDLTVAHLPLASAMLLSIQGKRQIFNLMVKFLAKIVCNTENFTNFVGTYHRIILY